MPVSTECVAALLSFRYPSSYLWSRARRAMQRQPRVYNMIREELALVKQNGAWKPRRKKKIIWPFLPSKWVKLSVLLIWFNFFDCSGLIRVQFYFIFIFLYDPSWSESIRVDPTQTGGLGWSGLTFVPASCQNLVIKGDLIKLFLHHHHHPAELSFKTSFK